MLVIKCVMTFEIFNKRKKDCSIQNQLIFGCIKHAYNTHTYTYKYIVDIHCTLRMMEFLKIVKNWGKNSMY